METSRTQIWLQSLPERPYRLFVPLGIALAWGGLFHWILFSLSLTEAYRSVFHSIAQIEGFLTCFALAFLFTALPRRTQSAPPTRFELAVGALAPVLTTILAWPEFFAASQIPWIVLAIVLLRFTLRRFRAKHAGRRPPAAFAAFPIAIVVALAGIVTIALYGALHLDFSIHQLGRSMLLQDVFLLFIIGAASLAIPQITRGESVPDLAIGEPRAVLPFVVAAIALVVSSVIEMRGLAAIADFMRGAIMLAMLLRHAHIHRLPTENGLTRWLLYIAVWLVPIGYALAALAPDHAQLGLHVVFLGGFGLMVLATGTHVTFAHEGRQDLAHGYPWQVVLMALFVGLAIVARSCVVLDPRHGKLWIGAAALLFLLATLCCGAAVARARLRTTFDV